MGHHRIVSGRGPDRRAARADTGFTARLELLDRPRPADLLSHFRRSRRLQKSQLPGTEFSSAPDIPRDATFAWSDTVARAGDQHDWAALRIYEAMRRAQPDFFIHCGERSTRTVRYRKPLPDGTVWKNLVTPEKSKVAQTLNEFRGHHL